jgi:hypothetical protein
MIALYCLGRAVAFRVFFEPLLEEDTERCRIWLDQFAFFFLI